MKYIFSFEEIDYLTLQLFISSTSRSSLNRRRKIWLLLTGMYVLLAFVFYENGDVTLSQFFIVASILSLIFTPFYFRWKIKRHFKNHIKEYLSKSFGNKYVIEFQEDHIIIHGEEDSESKISCSQVKSLDELPEHFLVRINNGHSLILPKKKIEQLDQLRSDLSKLANKLQLSISDHLKWKWEKSW